MPRIVSLGNTCLDIILSHTDRLPRWNSELIFPETAWRLGGQGANFAIAATYLGLKPILVSSIGTDDIGNRVRAELASAVPIDERFFRRQDSGTGFSVTLIRDDGERSFLTFLGHQSLFTVKPILQSLLKTLEDDDIVHISGLYMLPTLRRMLPSLFRQLRGADVRISFDPGWNPSGFSKTGRQDFYRLLSLTDFYEPNDAELKQLTGETSVQSAIRRLGVTFPGILALKLGKNGSKIIEPSGKMTSVPSYPTLVADTTGAGDVFDAGFIAGVAQDLGLKLSAKLGNAAASIVISRQGRISRRFPKISEVQRLIRTKGALF